MSLTAWAGLVALIAAVVVGAVPLGRYMARVYGGGTSPGDRLFDPLERLIYRVCRIDAAREQRWTAYAYSVLAFSAVSFLTLYALQRLQGSLPLNPTKAPAVVPHISFNAAVSFMTNTNWQSYGGETTMSHLTQMTGLAVQNFASAAAGMAVMAAFIRGLVRRRASTLGNFWVDLTRTTVRILLPLSFVLAILLVGQGVIQNLNGYTEVTTVEGAGQSIPGGPVASQVAIKQLGTNGGGFFNANSSHPFENPTPLSNMIENWAILVVPFALALAFGHLVDDRRQGWAVFAVMFLVWVAMAVSVMQLETNGNPRLEALGVAQTAAADQGGGSMEGKEVRFGSAACGLWAASTTGTSNGSIDCTHDSMTAFGGGLALMHILLGEVSPGGVGVGLNGLLVFAILAVFLAGLMVGRTPEYVGKKIQSSEVKLLALYILAMPLVLLVFLGAALFVQSVTDTTIYNPGQHGFTEMMYAYTSAANNNGSAFAGIIAATPWMNTTMGIAMLVGRFFLIIPVLAIAGSLVRKQRVPAGAGTFPTHTPLFVGVVIGVIVIVGALTFLPALALGPIVEQLSL